MRACLIGMVLWVILPGFLIGEDADAYSPGELQADFDALYEGLKAAHFDPFVHISQAEMDRAFQTRRAALKKPMTEKEARVFFQQFVALGKIAHARVDLPVPAFLAYLEAGGVFFPLDVKIVNQRTLITGNDSGVPELAAGQALIAMNGITMKEWYRRLGAYCSADTETMLHGFFETQFPFLLWLEVGEQTEFSVTVIDSAAKKQRVTVPARNRAFMQQQRAKRKGRLTLDDGRSFRVLPDGIGYLRPGPFYNTESEDPWDNTSFVRFIDAAFEALRAQAALIIDLRDNPGGSNSFSDHMLAWFADKPFRFASSFEVKVSEQSTAANAQRLKPGETDSISARYAKEYAKRNNGEVFPFEIKETAPRKGNRFTKPVYLLVNRHSYSNAVVVAAMVQDYGFGTVLGEETNDLATTYGAMERFTLPNTGISVGYPKAHIVRPNGDRTVRGVVPDIALATPLIEGEDDPVLTKAVEQVKAHLKQ
ncbi:S41 family peptidase [Acanthopleuribacter pedis]|uniref:Tail specific protease domain-containing protein n=1 Tax=Acanthopleuribacter pedis TaxID=442870 RepID=A0A8J7QCU1_9BACT|nr:S41 family peptidase [Acanthopleuribacter pedis]MBO1323371.1 hypothetical protein [Acanthopleuribacter pedis]